MFDIKKLIRYLGGYLGFIIFVYYFLTFAQKVSKWKEWDLIFFLIFGISIFHFLSVLNEVVVCSEELSEEREYSRKIEFCNLSDWSILFQCVSFPLARITLYKNFFVIVVFLKVYKFKYDDIDLLLMKKVKFFHRVIWIKMRKGYPQEFYFSTFFQKKLFFKLKDKVTKV